MHTFGTFRPKIERDGNIDTKITIVLNGREMKHDSEEVSFSYLCALAGVPESRNPSITYTQYIEGDLTKDEKLNLVDGIIINVYVSDNA